MGTTSPFIKAIIGTEIMSFVISLILLLGNKLENKRQSKRSRWFNILVLFEMIGCFSDAVSWILDGHSEFSSILYITTTCSMIVTLVLMGFFISYFTAYMREKREISNMPAIIGWAFVTVSVIATVIASATGNLFTFESGVFISKPLYSAYVVMNMLGMIIGLIFVIVYRKVLNWYDKLAAYSYMLFPMLAAAVGLLIDGFEFAYPTVAVMLLILYIILQTDRVEKLEQEGTITSYKATHDELTGLNNRSAYQERIRMLKSVKENSGVIFSDLNGLHMGAFLRKEKPEAIDQEIEKWFEIFPRLKERTEQLAGTLSGGEQQMLVIVRALISNPKLLILDEPSLGLAPIFIDEIFNIVPQLQKMGVTILLVEQNASMALTVADRGYVMENGKITLAGSGSDLLEDDTVRKLYLGEE